MKSEGAKQEKEERERKKNGGHLLLPKHQLSFSLSSSSPLPPSLRSPTCEAFQSTPRRRRVVLALVGRVWSRQGHWFAPYFVRINEGVAKTMQLAAVSD